MEEFDELIFTDDDDNIVVEPPVEPVKQQEQENDEDDFTSEVLKLKGIEDPSKIKFEDESGAVIERDWNSLTREEQLNIIAGEEPDELTDEETELLNTIRQSGLSVNEYLNSLQQEPLEIPQYNIDSLSDEDVYALDILEKVGEDNITDEELQEAVNQAKQNEVLFQKTVNGLRNEFKQREIEQHENAIKQQEYEQQQAYNEFASVINQQIQGLNSFAGQELQMSDEDVERLASYILDLDDNGMSNFGKALKNPELFTKAAFWILNENDIIEELNRQIRDSYTRGYESAKKDLTGKKPTLVFNKKHTTHNDDSVEELWD